MNFQESDNSRKDLEIYEDKTKGPWWEMIIVDRKRPIFLIEHSIYVILSQITPYIYAWFTVFDPPSPSHIMFQAMVSFEVFFFINIIFTFFVEYDVDDQI